MQKGLDCPNDLNLAIKATTLNGQSKATPSYIFVSNKNPGRFFANFKEK